MKIIKLTRTVELQLLRRRQLADRQAQRVANRILADVRRRGDAALDHWAWKLDRRDISGNRLWLTGKHFALAQRRVDKAFLRAIEQIAGNVRTVAERQLPREFRLEVAPGVVIQQMIRPIERIACYIPGGKFALVSTLLMTVIPAQTAGVKEIIAVCPNPNDALLAAAGFLGLQRLACVGGAQAIGALAYGTRRVPAVEKIFGPGNRYVTAAKQAVSADCAIDLPAGPTEAIVLLDNGNPAWIAADLLAQAEHAPDAASFLVTTSANLAQRVAAQVKTQLTKLAASNPAHKSTRHSGAILLADSRAAAIAFVNSFAPEHLSLPEGHEVLLKQIENAGTVFTGEWSAQPLGDYATGSNHVLPTSGWARRRGGLTTEDFVKRITVQQVTRNGFSNLADAAQTLANAEGLLAHAQAIEVRR